MGILTVRTYRRQKTSKYKHFRITYARPTMKYRYEKPPVCIPVYGELIGLEHPIYNCGTLFREGERGIVVVQKIFNPELKTCYWSCVDPAIANDIYTAPRFYDFFKQHAREKDYPIFQLRSLMWQLRMKPLKKESWEEYF